MSAPAASPARRRRVAPGHLFVAPALGAMAIFFALPVAAALLLSFSDFDLYALGDLSVLRFVGVENYRRLLVSPLFWTALGNTLVFCLVGGPLTVGAALGAAVLLRARVVRGRAFFRAVFFLPTITTLVAVAVVWRYLYHPRSGLVNHVLAWVGIPPVDWLGDPHFAMPAIILLAVWKNFGFGMVIFLAGLESIPRSVYEAARIDGAGAWAQLRFVTLPMLAPTLLFVAVVTAIGYLQLFAEPYVMTQGGPSRATTSMVLLMYEEGFRWWNLGYASAIAFVLFAVIGAATAVQLRLAREAA